MRLNARSLAVGTIAVCLLLAVADQALAQKKGRYAGYGAGIGALVGVVAGGDLGGAVVGAAVGAAGGAIAGSIADDKDQQAAAQQQQAEAQRQEAEAAARAEAEAERQAQTEEEQAASGPRDEAALAELIGPDNFESFKALRACQYDRAVALANAGATSDEANHQLASIWLQAVIATDRREPATAEQYLPQLVERDDDLDTVQQASLAVDKLVLELRQERQDLQMPRCG
jgi:hypothetical protein